MAADRQRLSKKVGQVKDAGDEHDAKLALVHAVTEPIEAHVQGLAVLRRHVAVGKPDHALVIAVDNSGRLGVAEIGQYLALIQVMRAAAKTPAISASATKETTTGMRVEWTETGWLSGASVSMAEKFVELPI